MTIHTLWLLPFGWILGALVNYLADVLPRTRRFSKPRCPVCGETYSWHYTLWPRRCQVCSPRAQAGFTDARAGSTDPADVESRGSGDPLQAEESVDLLRIGKNNAQAESPDPAVAESRGSGDPLRAEESVDLLRAEGNNARAWIVLLHSAAAVTWLWHNPPSRLGFWGGTLLSIYFGLVVVIDVEHHLILHPVSLVGAVIGAGFGVYLHGALDTLLGGVAGFGIMLGLYFLGGVFLKLLIRIRSEETEEIPLGFGDVTLAGVIGLLLGWPGITAGLLLAILIGGIVSGLFLVGSLVLGRYKAYTALPYGPFLATSAILLLF